MWAPSTSTLSQAEQSFKHHIYADLSLCTQLATVCAALLWAGGMMLVLNNIDRLDEVMTYPDPKPSNPDSNS